MPKRSVSSEPTAPIVKPPINSSFVDLERIEDVNGLVAIISLRPSTNGITFCIRKEFERDGKRQQSAFVGEHLVDAYLRLAGIVKDRIDELRRKGISLKDGVGGPVVATRV